LRLAILFAKLSRWLIRLIRPGGGSSVPGKIALILCSSLIERLRSQVRFGVIAVSGSAGKSSTTKLIVQILRDHGFSVFTNESTANIEQGLASSMIREADLMGRLPADVWVLELDESHAAKLALRITPDIGVLTNLMTDQLDRFDDPEEVLEKLEIFAGHCKTLVFNGDDPHLCAIRHPEAHAFAASSELLAADDAPELAPHFGENLIPLTAPELSVSSPAAGELVISVPPAILVLKPKLQGTHNAVNIAGAWLATAKFLGERGDNEIFVRAIESTEPVFARDELVSLRGKLVRLMLVQNPGSFRLNLKRLGKSENPIMIAIGSDVHDPSWIWSVDFSQFERVQLVSGRNANQLALWLRYQGIDIEAVIPDVALAADNFIESLSKGGGTVVLTADAMRRFRRHLGLAK
jgi:UDP-N-acetylmuramoylalanine-D-glutamate ligase